MSKHTHINNHGEDIDQKLREEMFIFNLFISSIREPSLKNTSNWMPPTAMGLEDLSNHTRYWKR
jgi:hypothetical protein